MNLNPLSPFSGKSLSEIDALAASEARVRALTEENMKLKQKQGRHVSELLKVRDALKKKNTEHHELRATILSLEQKVADNDASKSLT